jgi:hypothetical protein
MADDGTGLGRIERAIYVVGATVLVLLGIQALSSTGLDVYNYYAISGHPAPSTSLQVDWGVGIFVAILLILGGLFLAALAVRAHRRIRQSAA